MLREYYRLLLGVSLPDLKLTDYQRMALRELMSTLESDRSGSESGVGAGFMCDLRFAQRTIRRLLKENNIRRGFRWQQSVEEIYKKYDVKLPSSPTLSLVGALKFRLLGDTVIVLRRRGASEITIRKVNRFIKMQESGATAAQIMEEAGLTIYEIRKMREAFNQGKEIKAVI